MTSTVLSRGCVYQAYWAMDGATVDSPDELGVLTTTRCGEHKTADLDRLREEFERLTTELVSRMGAKKKGVGGH
jgi:hypothetical protein